MNPKVIKFLSAAAKIFGLVASFNVIPFVPPALGVTIVLVASTLKDSIRSLGDILDNGKKDNSFN